MGVEVTLPGGAVESFDDEWPPIGRYLVDRATLYYFEVEEHAATLRIFAEQCRVKDEAKGMWTDDFSRAEGRLVAAFRANQWASVRET